MKKTSSKNHLPNTSKWQPRKNAAETLQSVFLKRCVGVENLIRLRAQLERQMNIDNFDSGPGLEDIIREEFQKLCPARYSITSGVINDSYGQTAGDFDLIIFNDYWFPQVKAGATSGSRRVHFPIEGIYAVGEIKQSLDFQTLDNAMKKLVTCHRLNRPTTSANRLVENRESYSPTAGISNPLYSFILATELREGVDFEELIGRFFDINKSLKRLEVIRALCVLGHGTIYWGIHADKTGVEPALFMGDLDLPIFPVKQEISEVESALFVLILNLLLHLFHSVLAPEDIAASYGIHYRKIPEVQAPTSSKFWLMPDEN